MSGSLVGILPGVYSSWVALLGSPLLQMSHGHCYCSNAAAKEGDKAVAMVLDGQEFCGREKHLIINLQTNPASDFACVLEGRCPGLPGDRQPVLVQPSPSWRAAGPSVAVGRGRRSRDGGKLCPLPPTRVLPAAAAWSRGSCGMG